MEKVRIWASVYFVLQGAGVIGWWLLLLIVPDSRLLFVLEGNRETSLMSFWLADLVLIAMGSFAAAFLISRQNKYAGAAVWMVTGAVSYATFYTFAFVMTTDRGWLGVVLMFPATIWSGTFATALTVRGDMFRPARTASKRYILGKTLAQIFVIWTLILGVIPYLITLLEDKLGVSRFEFAYQRPLALVLLVLLSGAGIWSAAVMSRRGNGTPLPLDHARDLVVSGPYAFVRNPMAVTGIGQGLAVALFFGSPLVAVYALMGSAIWQLIFRPLEEEDLAARFGQAYNDYRGSVKCWFPRIRPFEPEARQGTQQ